MASSAYRRGYIVFKDENLPRKLKTRLYVGGVCSVVRYGAETYTLGKKEKARLNSFNSRCLANITGRSQHDEARSPTYDLVGAVVTTRARWLGHILRMDENSYLHKVVREIYHNNYEGSIICAMSLPDHDDFEDLLSIAKDRRGWNKFTKTLRTSQDSSASHGGNEYTDCLIEGGTRD